MPFIPDYGDRAAPPPSVDLTTRLIQGENISIFNAWNNRGYALYKLGKFEEALDSYQEAIAINTELSQAWFNITEVLLKLNRWEGLSRTCGDKRILLNKGRMPYAPTKTEFIPL